jgi:protein-S-isoprenylcysteine O-methyltransferase Ste14
MLRPLPFVWPYWPVFWALFVWAFLPEARIVRNAQKGTKTPDSRDAGSCRVIVVGMWIALVIAVPLAWVPWLRFPGSLRLALFVIGTALIVGGSLLRRHCFRALGASFTGDVRARPDQRIVQTGAYALLRHPAYTAGILMNTGLGLALGGWGGTLLLLVSSFTVYAYRIAVEERALLAVVGEPYRAFMRTRRRLIPFIY